MVRLLRVFLMFAVLWPAAAAATTTTAEPQPLGQVDQTFGRFDRNDLSPVGPTLQNPEFHAGPVLSPDGGRIAMGLSSPGSPAAVGPRGRVGLWLVDAATMTIAREVRTGIAVEQVVYPGVVGALTQNGELLVVDPVSGRILSRRTVSTPRCDPGTALAAGRGIVVTHVRSGSVEVAVIEPRGRVRIVSVPVPTTITDCGGVAVTTDGRRAYIVGHERVAVLDPATRRVVVHPVAPAGLGRSAAVAAGGLAVAGSHGLFVYDTTTWRLRWKDPAARWAGAAGNVVVVSGGNQLRALAARTGRLRWRSTGHSTGAITIAAGRVYALPKVLDLRTGAQVGTHPAFHTPIRLL